jgi:heme-degrading monooxygenase HmoA
VFLSAHIAEVGYQEAIRGLLRKPDPARIRGMRYAETWLTTELRTGLLPSLRPTGLALVTAWDDDDAFDRFLSHPSLAAFEGGLRMKLDPARSIGLLPGLPELPRQEKPTGAHPVAALTMATVRAGKFVPFAKAAGAAEREAAAHPGFLEGWRPPFVVGTLTLWRNADQMRQYAHGSEPDGHARAMKADREKQFHREMFFSRYIAYEASGQWNGRNPLANVERVDGYEIAQRALALDAIGTTSRHGEPTNGFEL